MNRENEQSDDTVIELGAVSTETKGPGVKGSDGIGQQLGMGLSDD